MVSFSEQRRQERVAASKAAGAATKAAKEAAANRQKTTALEKGGKYREGNTVYQVNVKQGKHYQIDLDERLSFSDTAKPEVRRLQEERRKETINKKTEEAIIKEKIESGELRKKEPGKNLSIELKENLGLSHQGDRKQPKGAITPGGAGLVSLGILPIQKGLSDLYTSIEKPVKDFFEKGFEIPIGDNTYYFPPKLSNETKGTLNEFKKGLIEQGLEVIESETKYGAGNVYSSSGQRIGVSKEQEVIDKFVQENKPENTLLQNVFEGKFSEITREQLIGGSAALIAPAVVPAGSVRAGEAIGGKVAKDAGDSFLKQAEKYFKESFQQLTKPKIVTETKEFFPKEGGPSIKFTTEKEIQVPVKDVFVSTGGIEDPSAPLRFLKPGKSTLYSEGKPKKIKNAVKEYTSSDELLPTYSPDEIAIQGKLSITELDKLGLGTLKGAQGRPKYLHTSAKGTTKEQRAEYKARVEQGVTYEVAKSKTAPFEDIKDISKLGKYVFPQYRKGKTLVPKEGQPKQQTKIKNEFGVIESIEKTFKPVNEYTIFQKKAGKDFYKGVFTRAKAERDILPEDPRPYKPSKTKFPDLTEIETKGGAGGTGKAKSIFQLSKEDRSNIIKYETDKAIAEQEAKESLDILFQGPRNLQGSKGTAPIIIFDQSKLEKQKGKSGTGGIQDIINAEIITPKNKLSGVESFGITDLLEIKKGGKQKQNEKAGLIFTDSLDVFVGQKPKVKPKEKLAITERLIYDLDTKIPDPGIPDFPPPEEPPALIPREKIIIPPIKPPPGLFYSGLGSGNDSAKKVYAAYGISSDINIKTLPTFSRYGSKSVFAEQEKEDKRIQELFYGKQKKRSKSKKTKTKKSKSNKRKKRR